MKCMLWQNSLEQLALSRLRPFYALLRLSLTRSSAPGLSALSLFLSLSLSLSLTAAFAFAFAIAAAAAAVAAVTVTVGATVAFCRAKSSLVSPKIERKSAWSWCVHVSEQQELCCRQHFSNELSEPSQSPPLNRYPSQFW